MEFIFLWLSVRIVDSSRRDQLAISSVTCIIYSLPSSLRALQPCGLVLGGNAKFHSRAKKIVDIIIDIADDASETIYSTTRALRHMDVSLRAVGGDSEATEFLTSMSHELDIQAADIERQASQWPVCRDYKEDPSSHHHILIHVYNSRINAWKKVDCDSTVLARNFYIPSSELFLNDACHWVSLDYNQAVEVFAENFPKFVLSFDINTEVIRRLELIHQCLKTNSGHSEYLRLTNLNECLAVLQDSVEDRRFELWVMTDD